ISDYREQIGEEISIINPLTAVQLFECSFDNLLELETQTKPQIEINIFKAILSQNEENAKFQQLAVETTRGLTSEIQLEAMIFSKSFADSELLNYNLTELFPVQIIKSIHLFEFLESNSNTPHLLST